MGTSTTSGSGSSSTVSGCDSFTASVSAASGTFDAAFLVVASLTEGLVTLADFALKERVDCAAVLGVDLVVPALLRRPGGIVADGCSGP